MLAHWHSLSSNNLTITDRCFTQVHIPQGGTCIFHYRLNIAESCRLEGPSCRVTHDPLGVSPSLNSLPSLPLPCSSTLSNHPVLDCLSPTLLTSHLPVPSISHFPLFSTLCGLLSPLPSCMFSPTPTSLYSPRTPALFHCGSFSPSRYPDT